MIFNNWVIIIDHVYIWIKERKKYLWREKLRLIQFSRSGSIGLIIQFDKLKIKCCQLKLEMLRNSY